MLKEHDKNVSSSSIDADQAKYKDKQE